MERRSLYLSALHLISARRCPYPMPGKRPAASGGRLSDGSNAFRDSIEGATEETRATFEELIDWAERLQASLPNVRLASYTGTTGTRFTLLPRIVPDDAGLVTIWNDRHRPSFSFWRSVFERRAPNSIEPVERIIAPSRIGQGSVVGDITPQLLEALTRPIKRRTRAAPATEPMARSYLRLILAGQSPRSRARRRGLEPLLDFGRAEWPPARRVAAGALC